VGIGSAVNQNGKRLAIILYYMGIVICFFGFFALPTLLIDYMPWWPVCNGSTLLYRMPAFSALLAQATLTESGICVFELFCAFVFLFRVGYVVAFWRIIIDWRVTKIIALGLEPKVSIAKGVAVISILFFVAFIIGLSSIGEVNSFGPTKMSTLLTSSIVLFVFTFPELILWFWFLFFGKIETQ
jgi:hypothetical protein